MKNQHLNSYFPIDFTQWYRYHECPAKWYEEYIHGWKQKPNDYLRDDALCVGSLYHAGMEQLLRTRSVEIPQDVIEENTPKPEALAMVKQMLSEYEVWAGREDWQVITIEKPLEFKIEIENEVQAYCLAKLDASVLVTKPTTIDNGLVGQQIELDVGYYPYEHKTKAANANRAAFLRRWELDAQPLFQQFALEEYVKSQPDLPDFPVRGSIINVAEKPNIYIPQRTCKNCKSKQDLSSYDIQNGLYVCLLCNHQNEFAPPKKSTTYDPTTFYRIKLDKHELSNPITQTILYSIVETYQNMQKIRNSKSLSAIEDPMLGYTKCIHPIWGPCVFVDAHTNRTDISSIVNLHQIDTTKYMKENKND